MRILQINANYGFGSTGVIVKDIGEMLESTGHEPFFAFQRQKCSAKNGIQIGNTVDWKIHALLCRILGRQGFHSTVETKRFLKQMDQVKPDIVHLHNLHSNFINLDLLLRFLAKNDIPTVVTMHDCWYFTGKCFHYVDYNCNRYVDGCGNCPKRKAPPSSYLFDWSKGLLKKKKKAFCSIPRLKLIGCSRWISEEARKSVLCECDIDVIYNGVDVSVFKPTKADIRQQYGVQDDFLVMGMANKWLQDQNIDMLEKVANMQDVRLMIVGCSREQQKIVKRLNENIVAIGFISEPETLAKYYSSSDVFVNLTHADTLPTVNMESICCGTPVITYDACGSPELVDDKTGIIVKEHDKEGIIKAILRVQNEEFNECAEYGRQKFDKAKCYKQYLQVYKEIINKKCN